MKKLLTLALMICCLASKAGIMTGGTSNITSSVIVYVTNNITTTTTNIPGTLFMFNAIVTNQLTVIGAFSSDNGAFSSDGAGDVSASTYTGTLLGNALTASTADTANSLASGVIINSPTNTAPLNVYGANDYIHSGSVFTLDNNIGHHFIHVWGQYTNSLSSPVYLWLTNITTHEVAPIGEEGGAVSPAFTNIFNIYLMCSGGNQIALTNKFTPGANSGVKIDGSSDNAW